MVVLASQGPGQSLEEHFAAGQRAIKNGQLEQAVAEFNKVLRMSPGLIEAEINLGLAHYLLGDYTVCAAIMAKVAHQRPEITPAVLFLGLSYLKLGSAGQAKRPLEEVVKRDPDNAEARRALAADLLALQDYQHAAEQFRALFALEADKGEAWFRLGRAYTDCASRLVRQMSRQFRKTAWGHRMAGDLYSQTERWELGIEEYRDALAADPKQHGLHSSLASVYVHQGNLAEAEREFLRELELNPSDEVARTTLVEMYKSAGNTGKAETLARSGPETKVSGASIDENHLAEGKRLFSAGQYEEAADRFAASTAFLKGEPEAIYFLARSYQMLAAACFRALEEVAPDSWQTHVMKAESYHLRNDDAQALKEYQEAVRLKPDAAEIYEQLGESYVHNDQLEQAQASLEKALMLEPARAHALYLLGELYVKKHDEQEAVACLRKALRYDANLLEAHAYLGRAYLRMGKPAEAEVEIEKALPIDIYGDLHYLLYRACTDLGKTELARAALQKSGEMRRSSVERDRDKLDRWIKN